MEKPIEELKVIILPHIADRERRERIVARIDALYQRHTTNQMKQRCRRCRSLDRLGILVYQMPDKLGGDWACSIMGDYPSFSGIISDGFKTRADAEKWALGRIRR